MRFFFGLLWLIQICFIWHGKVWNLSWFKKSAYFFCCVAFLKLTLFLSVLGWREEIIYYVLGILYICIADCWCGLCVFYPKEWTGSPKPYSENKGFQWELLFKNCHQWKLQLLSEYICLDECLVSWFWMLVCILVSFSQVDAVTFVTHICYIRAYTSKQTRKGKNGKVVSTN